MITCEYLTANAPLKRNKFSSPVKLDSFSGSIVVERGEPLSLTAHLGRFSARNFNYADS